MALVSISDPGYRMTVQTASIQAIVPLECEPRMLVCTIAGQFEVPQGIGETLREAWIEHEAPEQAHRARRRRRR